MHLNQFIFLALFFFVPFICNAQQNSEAVDVQTQLDPPYSGTIFIESDIVNSNDPTTFTEITYVGKANRTMFDRRVNNWINVEAYLFDVTFDDDLVSEVQVNPEFGSVELAEIEAEKYAWYIGQLPTALRRDVETVWIHKGTQPFGGGNNNILIHTGQSDIYLQDGILEETLIHEAVHTSLDSYHKDESGWILAQQEDPDYISTYARDYPTREDLAESFLLYVAVKYREDRISENTYDTVMETIPNRIAYFDNQNFDMYPIGSVETTSEYEEGNSIDDFSLNQNYPNPFNPNTWISFSLPEATTARIEIYSSLGQKIMDLAEGHYAAGYHHIQWDADHFASGVYFYRLVTSEFSDTKKMLLVK